MWSSVCTLTCLMAVTTLGQAITMNDCPRGLHRDRYLQVHGDYCYYFMVFKSQDFDDAKGDCRSLGGHLVYVKDKPTQDYLYYMLRSVYHISDPVWIGFTDNDAENEWEWLDRSKPGYTNWASGQPGIAGSVEDCAAIEMDDNGRWHDFRCNDFLFIDFGHPYVCQYGPYKPTRPPVTKPATDAPTTTTTILDVITTTTTTPPPPPTTDTTMAADTITTTTTDTTMAADTITTTTTDTTMAADTITTTTTDTTMAADTITTTTTDTTMAADTITTTTTDTTMAADTIITTTPTDTAMTSTDTTTTITDTTVTTQKVLATSKCPSANCPNLDCGLDGYKRGPNGCILCECDV